MSATFSYRPALDGVRAVAVAAVVVYHVEPSWLRGGFLGVDIFFVLSGFLIATLLLIEHDTKGQIDLPNFWARRFRRLMPALILAVLAIAVVENLTVDEGLVRAVRRDELLAALFYLANWFFIVTDSSYFSGFSDASPLRHTWSLSIEEQFYVGFPLLMTIGLARGGRGWLRAFFGIATIASIAAMAVLYDPGSASRAYFGTDSRIFQMLIGVLLAWARHDKADRAFFHTIGKATPAVLGAIVAMFVLVGDQSPFYYYGGAVAIAVLTGALVIGLETNSWVKTMLSSRPFTLLGLVSYGVYLWHWPIILWLRNHFGIESLPVLLSATVGATGVAAIVSYNLVERPIRKNGALFGMQLTPRRLALLVPAVSVLTAGAVVLNLADRTPEWTAQENFPALAFTDLPDLEASPLEPTGPIEVLGIVGDSVATSGYPGLRTEADRRGIHLLESAFPGCSVGSRGVTTNADGTRSEFADRCPALVEPSYDVLVDAQPDLILWHDLHSAVPRRDSEGLILQTGEADWLDSVIADWQIQLDRFIENDIPVVITMPARRSVHARGCETSRKPERCAEIILQDDAIRAATAEFETHNEGRQGVSFIDIDSLLCPDGYPCPEKIDDLTVREQGPDQTHFTREGSEWLAPIWLDRAIEAMEPITPS